MNDKDKQLYLVKRRNGKLEYFKRPQDVCSMPKFDIRNINNTVLYNPSKDSQAELFAKFIKDQCDSDFPTMKTAKGKRFVSSCILDPLKKEPWVYYKYPPAIKKKLHDTPIKVCGGWDEEAKPFTRVVAFAMELKLYAGAGPHSVTLPIG
ncbi:hypothetical protein E3N88_04109 [Mikania micrantha]|uniref:Uncharacterized protein n=1 Tax=Mikania micrantha TaxID=192012 RepID=A0A5N6PVM1_9ASTR|nr:hypothetical protein E3N88_04109 [Mikania micrantha]